tara:strand:- start:1379 stop:1714 length:336 start_codon:yes stop_codon:yes gene_type:complete
MVVTLRWVFTVVFVSMIGFTVVAAGDRSIFDALIELWPDPWFRATLVDAYFGFFTIWLWIAYRESGVASSSIWFVLIMTLGNIAVSGYFLWLFWFSEPTASIDDVLTPVRT